MLLYINNQSVNSYEKYFDIFFNENLTDKKWLKNSMLVGMGPFVSDFLTNGFVNTISDKNKVYDCVSKELSSISNMKVKHFFLSDKDNKIISKLPIELCTKNDPIVSIPKERMINPTIKSKEYIGDFYANKKLDNFQIFEFKNIQVPNLKGSHMFLLPDIPVNSFIINIQFIYNKKTGMMLTYLYNIDAIYDDELIEKQNKIDTKQLYKQLIPILDHMEISFDLKVE